MMSSQRRLILVFGALALEISHVTMAQTYPNVYALTLSIMTYSKWNIGNPTICVIDNSNAANILQSQIKQGNYNYKVLTVQSNQLNKANCQAVFFSVTPPQQQQQLINSYPLKGLLSFSSNNFECEIGSIICFYSQKNQNNFKINLDALALAKVHIDPRVLLLAKNAEGNK